MEDRRRKKNDRKKKKWQQLKNNMQAIRTPSTITLFVMNDMNEEETDER